MAQLVLNRPSSDRSTTSQCVCACVPVSACVCVCVYTCVYVCVCMCVDRHSPSTSAPSIHIPSLPSPPIYSFPSPPPLPHSSTPPPLHSPISQIHCCHGVLSLQGGVTFDLDPSGCREMVQLGRREEHESKCQFAKVHPSHTHTHTHTHTRTHAGTHACTHTHTHTHYTCHATLLHL